jgi:hypothetical protein
MTSVWGRDKRVARAVLIAGQTLSCRKLIAPPRTVHTRRLNHVKLPAAADFHSEPQIIRNAVGMPGEPIAFAQFFAYAA